jgi:S1-C subfamily serine protease
MELSEAVRAIAFIQVQDAQGKTAAGTGTLINPNGVMLTNHHVVRDAAKITVVLPTEQTSRFKEPRQYDATVIKTNPYYDLALLDIAAKTPHFLRFAEDAAVEVGREVKAIGNPHGLSVTVSQGIISSVRRNIDLRMTYTPIPGEYVNEREFEEITWIQTDASINPGNSGGPLLDATNRIIGINAWIVTETGGSVGLGFALHVKHVRKFARGYSRKE